WAITIGGTVLQNQLVKRLPEAFTEIRQAFADSIDVIWQVFIGIAGIGLLSSFFMKALPLHTQVDDRWGITEGKDSEMMAIETPQEKP
ncbi:hypothetical protein BDY19DRAFT_900943, partial [Irpex rosettiformis]